MFTFLVINMEKFEISQQVLCNWIWTRNDNLKSNIDILIENQKETY